MMSIIYMVITCHRNYYKVLLFFLSQEEIENFDILKIPKDESKGYILEVDLEYPECLHNSHNDCPLPPEIFLYLINDYRHMH